MFFTSSQQPCEAKWLMIVIVEGAAADVYRTLMAAGPRAREVACTYAFINAGWVQWL